MCTVTGYIGTCTMGKLVVAKRLKSGNTPSQPSRIVDKVCHICSFSMLLSAYAPDWSKLEASAASELTQFIWGQGSRDSTCIQSEKLRDLRDRNPVLLPKELQCYLNFSRAGKDASSCGELIPAHCVSHPGTQGVLGGTPVVPSRRIEWCRLKISTVRGRVYCGVEDPIQLHDDQADGLP
ncbi:uncharacterized protein BDV14DRAFT_175305 [Aspergillus stella-maris]|uniref:uncharacterized protein n=1 Tax=Aspergillus stella-maris TaxID=1810926 RepID=UPI003CCCB9B3